MSSLLKEGVHHVCHVKLAFESIITSSEMKKLVVKKALKAMWVPSAPMPTGLEKTKLCGCTHTSTQRKEPSTAHHSWMPKSILDEISPRSIDLANPNRRSLMPTQDKRWIWWAPLSNAAIDGHNGNSHNSRNLVKTLSFSDPSSTSIDLKVEFWLKILILNICVCEPR